MLGLFGIPQEGAARLQPPPQNEIKKHEFCRHHDIKRWYVIYTSA